MRTLEKTFSNEELIVKIIRCLNYSWKPKVAEIFKSRDLSTTETYTLFGKLQEYKMKLKRLAIDKEGKKKNKSLALTVEDSNSDCDMYLIVKNFKSFLRNEKQQK